MARKAKAEPKTNAEPLWVDIRAPKPNALWTAEQTTWIKFLIYNRAVPCAECGKKRKVMWTMLCDFKAPTLRAGDFVLHADTCQTHPPLTPVCDDHPLAIAWPDGAKESQLEGSKTE